MNRSSVFLLYLPLLASIRCSLASNTEHIIRVENFLANVNFSEPKLFYVRNNLDGDVVFQENENVSLLVHISANEEEMGRVKVEYDLLDGGSVVDIQVFIVPETTTNWRLIGGLAGTGSGTAIIIITLICLRKRYQLHTAAKGGKRSETTELGHVNTSLELDEEFEKRVGGEEKTLDANVAKTNSCMRQPSPLIQKKVAIFETSKLADETDNEEDKADKKEQAKTLQPRQVEEERCDSHISTSPRPQTPKFLTARAVFLVVTVVVVTMATRQAPTSRIVINTPAYFVKNGSKIFFNKDFHGRLLLSERLRARKQDFHQFGVSQSPNKVSSIDPCFASCKFACDVQVQQCICLRGYEVEGRTCRDVDECSSKRHNCHVHSTCNNTVGGFTCTCNEGYWGDEITCHVCSTKPCPEGFYQSESCTRTRDRVCTACSPKCGNKMTYQAYGCGLTFDRKCVDISKPLTLSKTANDSYFHEVRSGSKLIVLNSAKHLVLLEDRLWLNSSTATFLLQRNSPKRSRFHRSSSFYLDVEIEQANFVPKYNDYDAWRSNENHELVGVHGFQEVSSKHCRYPSPSHYTIRHELEQDRQTTVYPATCFNHSRELCPEGVAPGEAYYYRSLNDECDTAEEPIICQKSNQGDCILQQDSSKLYCTNYTNFLTDVFGIKKFEFFDKPLKVFPTGNCTAAYHRCRACRDTCSNCDKLDNRSCSCCYKECLHQCEPYYNSVDCTRIPKKCAEGDTSQFTLVMNKPSNLSLQFNCFLEYVLPKTLYTLKYKVHHETGRFSSGWISKTLKAPQVDDDPFVTIQRGTHRLDSLEVSHSTNFNISPLLYLQGQRASDKKPYKYTISNLAGENSSLANANATKTIKVQMKTPFSITSRSWSSGKNCQKLSDWSQTLRNTFYDLRSAKVEHLGVQTGGEISYHIHDPQRPPTMTVSISEDESILKYILTNSSIRNDGTFQSSLSRGNTTWNIKISCVLTSCPGFFTLQVIDEVDEVKVVEQDVVILCPETNFNVDIHVPRKNFQDKERLFSLFLSDIKQKLKLQLALVDKGSRKGNKEPVNKSDDKKRNPWITLMPLFVVTGCVMLCLVALMIYAQISHKTKGNGSRSRWTFVKGKDKDKKTGKAERKNAQPKDENRLKRRHLILVAFIVLARVVYSLVFTISMAFAVLTLLHGHNMKIIQQYQSFVQSKIDESNIMALRMDQHREREVKRILDASEDIQRSCDFFLGLQLQWLRYNMTCLIQENQLKMFNKLSTEIVKQVTQKIRKLKTAIDKRINNFQVRTERKIRDTKDSLENYGKRVYDNKWFALPRGAYNFKKEVGRKKRDIAAIKCHLRNQDHRECEKSRGLNSNTISIRTKRSIGDSTFIEFLDFLGAVDRDKLHEIGNNIKSNIKYAKDGLADFTDVLKTGKPPEHPLSMVLMCPLRFMLQSARKQVKRGIQKIEEEGEQWVKSKAACYANNISDFYAANDSTVDLILSERGFSERIMYEEVDGLDGIGNIFTASKSSLIESVRGGSFYNIEKGDILEEQVDEQKKELLEREGKIKNATNVFDAEVFTVTRKAVLGVVYIIDILLFIYRGLKTFQIVFGLIQGFEEAIEHDEDEFQEKPLSNKERAGELVRRALDFLAEAFSTFLTFCKILHKKIMRSNLLPICIVIAASGAVLYLVIVVVFNIMNVTVIEELGGYDLIASRLDTDYNFTNLAIADQVDFVNNNEMRLYKESVNETISEYNRMILNFNEGQQERVERLKRQLCSLENDANKCSKEIRELTASLLKFDTRSCIIPTLEGTPYEDYDGDAYSQRLKQESKRFVDAVRNIVLESIYFILGVVLVIIVISLLSFVVLFFLKSRGMVRVRQVHFYKSLPPDHILEQFHFKFSEYDNKKSDKDNEPEKLKIPTIFLTGSQENVDTRNKDS